MSFCQAKADSKIDIINNLIEQKYVYQFVSCKLATGWFYTTAVFLLCVCQTKADSKIDIINNLIEQKYVYLKATIMQDKASGKENGQNKK